MISMIYLQNQLLVAFSGYTKIPRPNGLYIIKAYLKFPMKQFWRMRSPRARYQENSVLVKAHLLVHRSCLLLVSSHGERIKGFSGISLIEALIPFTRAVSSWLRHLPKVSLLSPSLWSLGFQQMNWSVEHKTNSPLRQFKFWLHYIRKKVVDTILWGYTECHCTWHFLKEKQTHESKTRKMKKKTQET